MMQFLVCFFVYVCSIRRSTLILAWSKKWIFNLRPNILISWVEAWTECSYATENGTRYLMYFKKLLKKSKVKERFVSSYRYFTVRLATFPLFYWAQEAEGDNIQ